MTYFYLALLSYGVTFIGGFVLMLVEGHHDWKDCFIYGVINAVVFGTALYIALILFTLP